MKKKILITGGLGYIGSHAVIAFEEAGFQCVIIDNLINSDISSLDGIEKILGYRPDFFEHDLKDKNNLETIFGKYSFDGVLHFAGLKAVGESCENPLEYFDNNVVGSIKLFETMKKYGVKKIIFSSSATVYDSLNFDELGFGGVKEDDLLGNTSNPYGTTKFIIENILLDLSKFSSFNILNLRYFNPIGAHKSGFIGEKSEGVPNNLLPYIMKVATGELEALSVFGNNYNTVDGTGVRDYIDVVDLVDGHLKAYELLENLDFNGFSDSFNLGTGQGTSVLEMIKSSEEVSGKKIKYSIYDRREGDLGEVYCNPNKAKNILEWEAKTSVKESLKNSWKFYNK